MVGEREGDVAKSRQPPNVKTSKVGLTKAMEKMLGAKSKHFGQRQSREIAQDLRKIARETGKPAKELLHLLVKLAKKPPKKEGKK